MDIIDIIIAARRASVNADAEIAEAMTAIAPGYSPESTYTVGEYCTFENALYRCAVPITAPEDFNPAHWSDPQSVAALLEHLETLVEMPRFGVRGVGHSNATLTRLWTSVGMVAEPATDTVEGFSDFDHYAPFNRRKCVGAWSAGAGKAVFTVNAYEGDADYAEDGSMGDYVAVEVKPFYYIEDGDIIGVSEHPFPGWKIHPVCIDLDGNVRPNTYIPVYALALKNGHAVSLPGYDNECGAYKALWDAAATYDNAQAADYAILEPSAVDHYEWLLMTIEYATQNMQLFIKGASDMRVNNADKIVYVPAANKVVIGGTGSNFVVGQTILINDNTGATVPPVNFNRITALQKCTDQGVPSSSGAYWLITYDGADRSESITVDTTCVASRAWVNGATAGFAPGVNGVLGHTGSPVNLTNGKYPMRYRWRENVYSNQFMTSIDLAAVRVEESADVYRLDWYYLADPRKMTRTNYGLSDLTPDKGWVKLDVVTPSSSYVNGYIKALGCDERYPHVPVPVLTKQGSATTFYCDYAYLVLSYEVRAVRRRGYLSDGSIDGPRYFNAYFAPSSGSWYFGGGLYMIQ